MSQYYNQIEALKYSIIHSLMHPQKSSPQKKQAQSNIYTPHMSVQNLLEHHHQTSASPFYVQPRMNREQATQPYNIMSASRHSHSRQSSSMEKENILKMKRSNQKSQTEKIPRQVVFNAKIVSERFQKIKFLGKGKYSDVFLALDRVSQTIIALKTIQKKMIERFGLQKLLISEIKVHAYLKHPNILRYYGIMSDHQQVNQLLQKQFAIILECCESSLQKIIKDLKKQPLQFRNQIIYQIINGIAYMHSKHVIHRDIKPENVLLIQNQIKICDFGIAQHLKPHQQLNQRCGTIGYMAPEVHDGLNYDYRADAYSLGKILLEMYDENECQEFYQLGLELCKENMHERLSVEHAQKRTLIQNIEKDVRKSRFQNLKI